MALNSIYPEQFFNLPHPSAPFVSIQLRTKIEPEQDLDSPEHWEEITFNPNNFFNDLEIEDNGGVYNLKLNLQDKNYAYVEDVIVRSIVATKIANQLIRNPQGNIVEEEFFEFYVSKANSANLRIKFGYSEYSVDDSEYISANSFKSEGWKERTKSQKPVLKTPWIYFQMNKIDFQVEKHGLKVEIEAFSIMNNFLQNARLVEVFARLYGTPEYVINNIGNRIEEAARRSGDNVVIRIEDTPRGYPSEETGEEIIEVMLGGEPVIAGTNAAGEYIFETRYKNLTTIFNEICSNVRPVKYNSEGELVPISPDAGGEGEGAQEENREAEQVFRYSYYVNETENETEIVFYYRNPAEALVSQGNVRTYVWNQEGSSIVKDLNIETVSDFALLNLPIVNVNNSTGEITGQVMRGNSNTDTPEEQVDLTVGHATFTNAFQKEDFSSVFARHITTTTDDDLTNNRQSTNFVAIKLADKIAANLNEQVFRGTLSLFGDPYYLFDDSIKPFMYLIKIIVNRPNYVDKDGNFVAGGKSYLSGNYAVKKIIHKVSRSGFETELEIMKFNTHGEG